MSQCKNCNCTCHCGLQEHSDMHGVCDCKACSCDVEEVIVDSTNDCESCQ
jgi:hypothetical protein